MFNNVVNNSDNIALSEWMIMNNKWRSRPNLRSHLGIFLEAAA